MWVLYALLAMLFLPVILDGLSPLLRLGTRPDRGGDPGEGLVIFVESIRWLGVKWGRRTTAAGLRRAGFRGEFLYWPWHAAWRAWLVLPALMDRRMLEREARRLADFIVSRHRENPDRPVHLIGYSCGAFVALRAMELLDAGVSVESAAMLSPAFAPKRDLSAAVRRVRGKLVVCSSWADWFILGLCTLLFGTADRRHTFSAGMVGLGGCGTTCGSPCGCGQRANTPNSRIVQVRWRPGMVRIGHLGGHFSSATARFIGSCVAPAMGFSQRCSAWGGA